MENQINVSDQNTQQTGQKNFGQSEQEIKVRYLFCDPRSINIYSTKVQIIFSLGLIFGISFFAIIYSFFFGVSLPDLVNDPYSHINVLMLTILSIVLTIIVFAVINEGGLRKGTVPIPFGFRLNTVGIILEAILMIYFALKNNPFWYLFFLALLIHITLFYKLYGNIIKKIDSQGLGEKKAEEYYSVTAQGLRFTSLYFLVIPAINIIEIYLGWIVLGAINHGVVYFFLFIVIVLVQDLLILKVFPGNKTKAESDLSSSEAGEEIERANKSL